MRRLALSTARFLALALIGLSGAPAAQGLDFAFYGPLMNSNIVPGLPIPTGLDFELSSSVAQSKQAPLDLSLHIYGVYDDLSLLRDPATGDPAAPADTAEYNALSLQWDFGATQALLTKPGAKRNLLEAFLLYRGRFDQYYNDLPSTLFPDARGIWGTALVLGLGYKDVHKDGRRVMSGASGELSLEWGPAFLSSGLGAQDYWRGHAKGRAYLPLFSRGEGERNLFSAYLAAFGSFDLAGGEEVPLFVMQSFGGRYLRDSLGGSVRGYVERSYDASLKAVGNLELRLLGPAIPGISWFLPMVYGFVDGGYYSGLERASPTWSDASGFIASAGGGFALDLFEFAFLGLRASYLLPGDDALYQVYYPEEDRLVISLELLLHF